jgi:hypothetical protein
LRIVPALRSNTDSSHRFQRTVLAAQLTYDAVTGFNATNQFDLEFTFSLQNTVTHIAGISQVIATNPGYSEILNLYQEYRIDSVDIQLISTNNISGSAQAALQTYVVAMDLTDAAQTTANTLLEFGGSKIIQLGNQRTLSPLTFSMSPRAQNLAYNGITSSYTLLPKSSFLNSDYPATPHYGFKMVNITPLGITTSSTGTLQVFVRYHIVARKTH